MPVSEFCAIHIGYRLSSEIATAVRAAKVAGEWILVFFPEVLTFMKFAPSLTTLIRSAIRSGSGFPFVVYNMSIIEIEIQLVIANNYNLFNLI